MGNASFQFVHAAGKLQKIQKYEINLQASIWFNIQYVKDKISNNN